MGNGKPIREARYADIPVELPNDRSGSRNAGGRCSSRAEPKQTSAQPLSARCGRCARHGIGALRNFLFTAKAQRAQRKYRRLRPLLCDLGVLCALAIKKPPTPQPSRAVREGSMAAPEQCALGHWSHSRQQGRRWQAQASTLTPPSGMVRGTPSAPQGLSSSVSLDTLSIADGYSSHAPQSR